MANLELDDSREFGFCQYCGTKVMIEKSVSNYQNTSYDNRSNMNNSHNSTIINNYYVSGGQTGPINTEPRSFQCEIFRPKRVGELKDSFSVKIDGVNVFELSRGNIKKFTLTEGMHKIRVYALTTANRLVDAELSINIKENTQFFTGTEGNFIKKIYILSSPLK